jgi:Na+/H+ antiporter NhaD/arsenite permease-like protein
MNLHRLLVLETRFSFVLVVMAAVLLGGMTGPNPVQAQASTDPGPRVETSNPMMMTTAPIQEHAEGEDEGHGAHPPLWLVLPFIIMLVMIATGPLFYPHHWHHHYPKYAAALGAVVTVYYLFVMGAPMPMVHALEEYLAFIALVASLFIAASGIYIQVNAKGTPLANSILLFVGSVVANIIATTGAAMLFIRSYMRLNKGRLKPYHICFFIFLVANIGGGLTPIGDPPLFLGFLRGVPFFWTLTNVWYVWLPTVLFLLAIFYVFDTLNEEEGDFDPELENSSKVVELEGSTNFWWVLVVILSVFIDPNVIEGVPELSVAGVHMPFGIREVIMFAVCYLAYKTANKEAMEKNRFNFEPIREVGWLFLGIFATMVPALDLISLFANQNADSLTVSMFFWGTGILSGFLDNAPTYLNFLAAAMGKFGMDVGIAADVRHFAYSTGAAAAETWEFLHAISVAAVFFGAISYIGNAPNFMVKAIADSEGADAPSFMGYIVKYSVPILIPTYFLVWVVFYSGWVF